MFRLYGPTEAMFGKICVLPHIERCVNMVKK
jgi:hypothetical protein